MPSQAHDATPIAQPSVVHMSSPQSLVRGERVVLSKVDAFADGVAVSGGCSRCCCCLV